MSADDRAEAEALADLVDAVRDEDINELWKHHAKECVRIALLDKQFEQSSPMMLELAAQHAAVARCIYEHGWLSVTKD